MDIGGTIKRFREQKNMQQKDLARFLNVSDKTISSWETNRTQPKMEMIEEMCKIFDCQKSDFLSDPLTWDYIWHDKRIYINTVGHVSPEYLELYKDLFNAASGCSKDEIVLATQTLEAFKKSRQKE